MKKIISFLLATYVIAKPFYLWSSGLPQISDIILIIAFVLMILNSNRKVIRQTIRENNYFFVFVFFVVVINLLYSIYYQDLDFLLHSLYYVFDALGIVLFVFGMKEICNFDKILNKSFRISLLMQLLIFILHIGRYYGETRYMGTFNDPNQFAYYCFLSFGFIYLLSRYSKRKVDLIYFVIATFLIFQSASTGMLVGMSIFLILYLIPMIKNVLKNPIHIVLVILSSMLVFCIGSLFNFYNSEGMFSKILDSQIVARTQEKFTRASGDGQMTLWQERGYDRIYYYPQYLLYGAGEGRYFRFDKTLFHGEFHATLPSILFCYGLIPTLFVIVWMYRKLKGQPLEVLSIYFALLLESFTLINSRQVLFWAIFIIVPLFKNNERRLE